MPLNMCQCCDVVNVWGQIELCVCSKGGAGGQPTRWVICAVFGGNCNECALISLCISLSLSLLNNIILHSAIAAANSTAGFACFPPRMCIHTASVVEPCV